jgi:hypothetical protein
MNLWAPLRPVVLLCLLAHAFQGVSALTLKELQSRERLTPDEFAAYFSDFRFVFHSEIQNPERFLSTRSGDCDDYATLAASILREKGYSPRLIAVRMPGVVHVVCYIEETQSYLDYNYRNSTHRAVKSSGEMSEIARNVAKSFGADWSSASEFTFNGHEKQLVATVLEKQPTIAAARKHFFAFAGANPALQ